jgi:2-methylfumaryl-CoA hydratase
VRSRAFNQQGVEVLSWVRWVMIPMRKEIKEQRSHAPKLPELPQEVEAFRLSVPAFLKPAALEPRYTGSMRAWEDYTPGEVIDHPGGMTLEEAEHMLATRLYQNTARIHFDAFSARGNPFGKRLIYAGHVNSLSARSRTTGSRTLAPSRQATGAAMPSPPSRATPSIAATSSSGATRSRGAPTWERCACG